MTNFFTKFEETIHVHTQNFGNVKIFKNNSENFVKRNENIMKKYLFNENLKKISKFLLTVSRNFSKSPENLSKNSIKFKKKKEIREYLRKNLDIFEENSRIFKKIFQEFLGEITEKFEKI